MAEGDRRPRFVVGLIVVAVAVALLITRCVRSDPRDPEVAGARYRLLNIDLQLTPEPSPSPVPDTPPDAAPTCVGIALYADALFDFGRHDLRPDQATRLDPLLSDLTDCLQRPGLKLRVTGHTDSVGSDADNLTLSEARARAVASYLVVSGVDPARLLVEGRGESQLLADHPADASEQRRVVVTPEGEVR